MFTGPVTGGGGLGICASAAPAAISITPAAMARLTGRRSAACCFGAAGLGAGVPLPPPITRPARLIRSVELAAWVFSIKPPGVISSASPPGVIDRYELPRMPAEVIIIELSVGSLMSSRMLICTVTR